jgi:hypothetical protein
MDGDSGRPRVFDIHRQASTPTDASDPRPAPRTAEIDLNEAFPACRAARSTCGRASGGASDTRDARATRERRLMPRNGRAVAPTGGNVTRSARPGSATTGAGPEPVRPVPQTVPKDVPGVTVPG